MKVKVPAEKVYEMLQMIREIKDTLKIQETNDDLKIIED